MRAVLLAILKLLAALAFWIGTAFLISDSESAPFVGTLVLAAIAVGLLFIGRSLRVRVLSGLFVLLVVLVSHATDVYFWDLVWNEGYPWPFAPPTGKGAFAGSITPFIIQISIVSFSVLLVVALAMVAWHLREKGSDSI
jgi:hypothetical protein